VYASADAARSVDRLADLGADSIAIWVTQFQPDTGSTAIGPTELTPTDDSLRAIVRRARNRGLRVLLRPIVDVEDGSWRGDIRPAETAAWFASYRSFIYHYADLAASLGVPAFAVGCEYSALTAAANDVSWREVIRGVRERFHGSVTYAANWDEYGRIGWWDALDVIGLDAYFPLWTAGAPTVDGILRQWSSTVAPDGVRHRWLREITAVHERFRKPVVFTEVGWRSITGTLQQGEQSHPQYAVGEQARAFEALFRTWSAIPWFRGIYVWDWPAAGRSGRGDVDYSPRGKPAARVIGRWFRAGR
jgi:hypothetical protein